MKPKDEELDDKIRRAIDAMKKDQRSVITASKMHGVDRMTNKKISVEGILRIKDVHQSSPGMLLLNLQYFLRYSPVALSSTIFLSTNDFTKCFNLFVVFQTPTLISLRHCASSISASFGRDSWPPTFFTGFSFWVNLLVRVVLSTPYIFAAVLTLSWSFFIASMVLRILSSISLSFGFLRWYIRGILIS